MTTRTRPDVYVTEPASAAPPSLSTDVAAIPIVVGVSSRGPIGAPVKLRAPIASNFVRTFGRPVEGETAFYLLESMERARVPEAYFLRAAHYTDPADADTMVGAASALSVDSISQDAPAQFVGALRDPTFNFDETQFGGGGPTFEIDVNSDGPVTVAIAGTKATIGFTGADAAAPNDGAALPADTVFTVEVSTGDVSRVVDLSGLTFASWTALYSHIMAEVPEIIVSGTDEEYSFSTRLRGSFVALGVSAVSANAGTILGITAGTVNGTGNFLRSDAITAAEIAAMIEAEIPNLAVTFASEGAKGRLVLTNVSAEAPEDTTILLTDFTGQTADLLGITALAFTVTGVGAGTVPALRFEAGYRGLPSPGVFGDSLRVSILRVPVRPTRGAGADLVDDVEIGDTTLLLTSAVGVRAGTLLRLFEGAKTAYVTVSEVRPQLVGGVPQVEITLTAPLTKAFTAALGQVESVEYTVSIIEGDGVVEEWTTLSPLKGADSYLVDVLNHPDTGSVYVRCVELAEEPVGTLATTSLSGGLDPHVGLTVADFVGDADARTGFEALRSVQDAEALMLAPSTDPAAGLMPAGEGVAVAMDHFARSLTGVMAFHTPPLAAKTKADVATWRLSELGADSPSIVQWPWVRVRDRFGSGVNPTRLIPPTGATFGAWAKVLTIPTPEGGVARAAAGEPPYGELAGVLGLSAEASDKDHGDLNVLGVQVIRMTRLPGGRTAPLLMGARTLSSDPRWTSASARRTHNFIARQLKLGLQFAVFRNNNDPRRITPVLTTARNFLRALWRSGQIRGATEQEAFYVVDATTTEDVLALTTRIRVGVAYQRPSEFIEVEMVQLSGESSLTEL